MEGIKYKTEEREFTRSLKIFMANCISERFIQKLSSQMGEEQSSMKAKIYTRDGG